MYICTKHDRSGGETYCPTCWSEEQARLPVGVTLVGLAHGPPIDVPSIMRAGGFEEGVREERARIVAIIDARLMVVEPNDSDVGDELHGRAMELHHLRRTIDLAAPPLRPLADETLED